MIANKKSLLALSVASALTLSGCFSDDDNNVTITPPPEPTDPVIVAPETPDALALVVNGNVVNADFDAIKAQVTLLENGELSANTVDVNGTAVNVIDATEGDFTFTLKEGAAVDSITVNVTAEGYVSKSFIVDLTLAEGESVVPAQLELVSKNAEGLADKVVEASVTDATTAEVITAKAESGKAGADVAVPANTQLLDANNNPVSGSTISLNVTAADSTSASAGAILPEGLNAAGAAEVKTPVAVTNIVMTDDAGNKIKKFSKPIEVTMAIPATTTLSSGEAVKTGDELTLTSHNEDTGVWSTETNKVTIGTLNEANGTYAGSFMTDHLTFFSAVDTFDACQSDINVTFSGDAIPANGLTVKMESSDYKASVQAKAGSTSQTVISANKASQKGIAADATARVTVKDKNGNTWFDSETEVSVCGNVNVALANPVTLVAESLAVTAVCENDNTVTTPLTGAVVKYRLENKGFESAAGTGGTYELTDLVEASSYEVRVVPRGAKFAGLGAQNFTITADGTDETAEITVACDEVTGS